MRNRITTRALASTAIPTTSALNQYVPSRREQAVRCQEMLLSFFRVNRSTKCSFHPTVDVAVAAALLAAVADASELKCEVDRACHQGFSARAERDALSNMYTDVF